MLLCRKKKREREGKRYIHVLKYFPLKWGKIIIIIITKKYLRTVINIQ